MCFCYHGVKCTRQRNKTMMYQEDSMSAEQDSFDKFIYEMLKGFFAEFQKKITEVSLDDLCILQKAFSNDWNPDYGNELHRLFYLLKYAMPYCIEYREIYRSIIRSDRLNSCEPISVLSLGCGAVLDLVSLYYACQEEAPDRQVYYHGIDIQDWGCGMSQSSCIKMTYENLDNVTPSLPQCPYNIIIFPKSISDIDLDCIKKFFNRMDRECLSDNPCIVLSRRKISSSDAVSASLVCSFLNQHKNLNLTTTEPESILGKSCLSEGEDRKEFISFLEEEYRVSMSELHRNIQRYLKDIPEHICKKCYSCGFKDYFLMKYVVCEDRVNAEPLIYYSNL